MTEKAKQNKMTDLVFSIPEIKEKEGLTFSKEVAASELVDEPAGRAQIDLEFSVGGEDILLEGKVGGTWTLECSRCLVEHSETHEEAFEEVYPLDQGTIDTTEDVRQNLLLTVPGKPLCRTDCRGLCPHCGKNLNEGPCQCKSPAEQRGAVNAKPKA